MFKEAIERQLVAKYPGVSKKVLGLFLPALEAKVTEESQIEGAIAELDTLPIPITTLAAEFQKEGDERVTQAKAKWARTPPKQEPTKDPESTDPPAPQESPVETLLRQVLEKVNRLEGEKIQSTITQKITAAEKLKGIPATYYNKRKLPESEEQIEAFVDEVASDYSAFKQELTDQGFAQGVKPPIGNPPAGGEKVSADMQNYLAAKNAAAPQKN